MDDSLKPLLSRGAQLGFAAVAALLVYSFVSVAKEGELRRRCTASCLVRPAYMGADRKAPAFTAKDMTGGDVSLSDYAGKVVILNFWTKTCGPCLEEMPELADLTEVLRDRSDVAVLTVSTDDGPDDVRDTLKTVLPNRKEAPFPVLFDPDSKIVGEKFGTHLFPETWIIDKRGVIRARFDGAREWTSPMVVELVDQIRKGGYCPLDVKDGQTTGEAAGLCTELSGR